MPIINPGSGPVSATTEEDAVANMAAFVADLITDGQAPGEVTRRPSGDYGEGRYCFDLAMDSDRTVEIQMPGRQLGWVRYVSEAQNIWHFPRLYVDGSSWAWMFAISVCKPDED